MSTVGIYFALSVVTLAVIVSACLIMRDLMDKKPKKEGQGHPKIIIKSKINKKKPVYKTEEQEFEMEKKGG